MSQNFQDEWVLNFIKCFLKINFEDHYFFLGVMAQVEELKAQVR
jgi:hypothetical protein